MPPSMPPPLLLLLPLLAATHAQYLLRTSPGGDGVRPAGVWGGRIDLRRPDNASDLFTHGFSTVEGLQGALKVEGMSFDRVGGGLLLAVDGHSGTVLATADSLCDLPPRLSSSRFTFTDSGHPLLQDTECGAKCGLGPVTRYKGRNFALVSVVLGRSWANLDRQIQVREVTECKGESILRCSTLIATLHKEKYTKPQPTPSYWPASQLIARQSNNKLLFYVQLLGKDHTMSLVSAGEGDVSMTTLHVEDIPAFYTSNLKLRGLGAIDIRDEVACWTAGHKLLCSLLNETPRRTVVVVDEGQAQHVCKGTLPHPALQNTLTGVAIAAEDKTLGLTLYFGCYSELAATGGLGVASLSRHGLKSKVTAVKSGSRRLLGGLVLVVDDLLCSGDHFASTTTPSGPSSARLESRTTVVASAASSGAGRWEGLVCLLVMLAMLNIVDMRTL